MKLLLGVGGYYKRAHTFEGKTTSRTEAEHGDLLEKFLQANDRKVVREDGHYVAALRLVCAIITREGLENSYLVN